MDLGDEVSTRSIRAYEKVPYIKTVVDMMDDKVFQEFLAKNSRQNWESLGVYVRLYSDLCTFYKQNAVAILNLYKKTGGDCTGINQKEPSKKMISWMMATVMRNGTFRKNWFQQDRIRKKKRGRKKKKMSKALIKVDEMKWSRFQSAKVK